MEAGIGPVLGEAQDFLDLHDIDDFTRTAASEADDPVPRARRRPNAGLADCKAAYAPKGSRRRTCIVGNDVAEYLRVIRNSSH